MQPSLGETRHRLTPITPLGDVRFSSIYLKRPSDALGPPKLPFDGLITFRLGIVCSPPEKVIGRVFDEGSGRLLAELRGRVEVISIDELECSFKLPRQLPNAQVCFVVEGDWLGQAAGCEMSFRTGG